MAATRYHGSRAPPLQIFQDPIDAEAYALPASHGAILDRNSPDNMSFNPSYSVPTGLSPMKPSLRHSSSPAAKALSEKRNLNSIVFPPPPAPHFGQVAGSPMKRIAAFNAEYNSMGEQAGAYRQEPYPSTYLNLDQENAQIPAAIGMKNQATIAAPIKKTSHKRKLTDSTPSSSSNGNAANKKQKTEPIVLPPPECMPVVEDDGLKPPYSYAQLIGMAILRAPNRRLTLASIYNWISSTFAHYQAGDAGWQNSIRHNLSLNKAFHKQERPKDDPGKGNYWAIVSGMESQFVKEKPRRNTLSSEAGSFHYPNATDLPRPGTSSSNANLMSELQSFVKKIDSSKFPDEADLSSDATIPASDPAIHEGIEPTTEKMMLPPPTRTMRSSPPPVDIRSSPPPGPEREDTPPRPSRQQPSSRPSGGRKRKFGGLGDSGYYSSIESSATRNVRFLTSEVDREHPARKRGRAEEEIMRMRSSSIDISPTKLGARLDGPISFSSSPFKATDASHQRGPLTPAVVFKKPARPPMSVSPGTNLRQHREHVRQLLGSPAKQGYSPYKLSSFHGLELPNSSVFELFAPDAASPFPALDVFADEAFLGSSPLKSAKRPRLERTVTSTDALHDIFGTVPSGSPVSSHTDFKSKLLGSPVRLGSPKKLPSPTKRDGPTSHPTQIPAGIPTMALPDIPEEEDFMFAVNIPSDDSEGVDISKGFEKIGAKPPAGNTNRGTPLLAPPPMANQWMQSLGSPSKHPAPTRTGARPSLGRSSTTRF